MHVARALSIQLKPPASGSGSAAPPPPPEQPQEVFRGGRDLADDLKRRSTLALMLEPAGMTLGLASTPRQTAGAIWDITKSAATLHLSQASDQLTSLAHQAVHPTGVPRMVYKAGLGLKAGAETGVGGLELVQGLAHGDKSLALMGGADIVGGAAAAAACGGAPMAALGLSLAAAAAKTGLIITRHDGYSRVQKLKTFFDATDAVTDCMVQAGVGVVPALLSTAVLAPTELLYMNHEGFRKGADKLIDWGLSLVHPKPQCAKRTSSQSTAHSSLLMIVRATRATLFAINYRL